MKLTRAERWILTNQYRMLAILEPENSDHYARKAEALEHGYEGEYEREDFSLMYKDEDSLSPQQCHEVVEILGMYEAMHYSHQELSDKSGIKASMLVFPGFDGNDTREITLMSYARYYCEPDGRNLFKEIRRNSDGFNSHCPMLSQYQAMLREWKASADRFHLTREDILRILEAR